MKKLYLIKIEYTDGTSETREQMARDTDEAAVIAELTAKLAGKTLRRASYTSVADVL